MAVRPAAPLVEEGRRVESAAKAPFGEFTYTVVEPAKSGEKRDRPRQRTRLRTGKLIDLKGRFLTECLIYDRSATGVRLRLPVDIALTRSVQIYDDQSAALFQADVVWRLDREIGLRFRDTPPTERTRTLQADMRRRYYAVPG